MDLNLYVSDTDINDNVIVNPLHLFFQEIELSVKIYNGIYGCKYYIDLERFVFNKRINSDVIKNEINAFIAENCNGAKHFPFNTVVQFLKLEDKDIIYIEVTIYDKDNDRNFIQKFVV